MLVLSLALALVPSAFTQESKPIFAPASANLEVAKDASLLQLLESYAGLTDQRLVIEDDVRGRLAKQSLDLLQDAVVPKERVQGFVEGFLVDRGCGMVLGGYVNGVCVYDDESDELPGVLEYVEWQGRRSDELARHPALLIRRDLYPYLASEVALLSRFLMRNSRLEGVEFDENSGSVSAWGWSSHIERMNRFVSKWSQPRGEAMEILSNANAGERLDSEVMGKALVLEANTASLLKLVRRCFEHAGLNITMSPEVRAEIEERRNGLQESVTVAAEDVREFAETLLLINGFGVRELQSGSSALLAIDEISRGESDDHWGLRSFRSPVLTRATGSATQCTAVLDVGDLEGRLVPATMRPFLRRSDSITLLSSERRLFIAGGGLQVKTLARLLSTLNDAARGTADFAKFALEYDELMPKPEADLVFDQMEPSLLDLVCRYFESNEAVLWVDWLDLHELKRVPITSVPLRIPKEEARAILSRQLYSKRFSLSRLPTTPPVVLLSTYGEPTFNSIVDADQLTAFDEFSPLQVATIVVLENSSRQVPAYSIIACDDFSNQSIGTTGSANTLLIRGPISFVKPYVEELRQQDRAGEFSFEAWKALRERMDARRSSED